MEEKVTLEKNGLSGTDGQIVVRWEGPGMVKATMEHPFLLDTSKVVLLSEGFLQLTPATLHGVFFCRARLYKSGVDTDSLDYVASGFLDASVFNEPKFSTFDEVFKFLSTNCCSLKIIDAA